MNEDVKKNNKLTIILIVVIVLMNSLKSEGTGNLPQPVLPPEPTPSSVAAMEDPLFEPVEVIEEPSTSDESLEKIAEKLKQESMQEGMDEPQNVAGTGADPQTGSKAGTASAGSDGY